MGATGAYEVPKVIQPYVKIQSENSQEDHTKYRWFLSKRNEPPFWTISKEKSCDDPNGNCTSLFEYQIEGNTELSNAIYQINEPLDTSDLTPEMITIAFTNPIELMLHIRAIINFLQKNVEKLVPLSDFFPKVLNVANHIASSNAVNIIDLMSLDSEILNEISAIIQLSNALSTGEFLESRDKDQIEKAAQDIKDQIDWAKSHLAKQNINIENVHFFSYSQGGAVALGTSLLYPGLAKTVISLAGKFHSTLVNDLKTINPSEAHKNTRFVFGFKNEDPLAQMNNQINSLIEIFTKAGMITTPEDENEPKNITFLPYPGNHYPNDTDKLIIKTTLNRIKQEAEGTQIGDFNKIFDMDLSDSSSAPADNLVLSGLYLD